MDEDNTQFDDEGKRQVAEYESPYPIDDRHLSDSIYALVLQDHAQLETFAKAYKTLKLVINLLLFGLLASFFALIVLGLTSVKSE